MVLSKVKEVDLPNEEEDPKPIFIAIDFSHLEEQELLTLLEKFRNCFTWDIQRHARHSS